MYIDRQKRALGAKQQRLRGTALSSKCGQCHAAQPSSDEAEHILSKGRSVTAKYSRGRRNFSRVRFVLRPFWRKGRLDR